MIKFFKKNIYFIASFVYFGAAVAGFVFTISFVAKIINSSLPGGSEIVVPEVSFNVSGYKDIEDLVGVALKEEVSASNNGVDRESETSETDATSTAIMEIPIESSTTSDTVPGQDASAATSTATSTEDIVEEEVLDKSQISISVQNGSGVSGVAAKLELVLEADGFTVAKIGNTERADKSQLEIKDSKTEYKDALEVSIKKSYEVYELKSLDEGSEYDAIFIIGRE